MKTVTPIRVGTRGSPLARAQTTAVIAALARHGVVAEAHIIVTTGDAVQDRTLAEIGGKGLFAKEIHEALAAGRIDLAVHSLKDLETTLPPGIVLGCTTKREDARDALVLPQSAPVDATEPFAALRRGARVGSASVRRQAQLKHARPDLEFVLLRGNVETRLRKLEEGEVDATLLAYAGLRRLGLAARASAVLGPDVMLPAAAQGIVGVTVRADDAALRAELAGIEDAGARAAATAERAMLGALDGSCRTPIGAYARLLEDGSLHLTGLVARADGSFLLKRSAAGTVAEAEALGRELGAALKAGSPEDIFAP